MAEPSETSQLIDAIRRIERIDPGLLDLPETRTLLTVLEAGELPEHAVANLRAVVAATDRRLIVVSASPSGSSERPVQSLRFDSMRNVRSTHSGAIEVETDDQRVSFNAPGSQAEDLAEYVRMRMAGHDEPAVRAPGAADSPGGEAGAAVEMASSAEDARDDDSLDGAKSLTIERRKQRLKDRGITPNPESTDAWGHVSIVGFIVSAVLTWAVDVNAWVFGVFWLVTGASFVGFIASTEDMEHAMRREEQGSRPPCSLPRRRAAALIRRASGVVLGYRGGCHPRPSCRTQLLWWREGMSPQSHGGSRGHQRRHPLGRSIGASSTVGRFRLGSFTSVSTAV